MQIVFLRKKKSDRFSRFAWLKLQSPFSFSALQHTLTLTRVITDSEVHRVLPVLTGWAGTRWESLGWRQTQWLLTPAGRPAGWPPREEDRSWVPAVCRSTPTSLTPADTTCECLQNVQKVQYRHVKERRDFLHGSCVSTFSVLSVS